MGSGGIKYLKLSHSKGKMTDYNFNSQSNVFAIREIFKVLDLKGDLGFLVGYRKGIKWRWNGFYFWDWMRSLHGCRAHQLDFGRRSLALGI